MPNQSFLPVIDTRLKSVLGMVPITTTDFSGEETSFSIPPGNYTLVKWEPWTSRDVGRPWFMAIAPSYLETRNGSFASVVGFMPLSDMLPGQWWQSAAVGPQKIDVLGSLIQALLDGFGTVTTVTVTPPTVSTPTSSSFVWSASAPFANQPQSTFIDLNWVEAVGLSGVKDKNPTSLTITSVTDGADAAQSKVRAILVISGQPALNRATYNTVRVVRMPNQIVNAGDTFKINGVISGQSGWTANVTINITVV